MLTNGNVTFNVIYVGQTAAADTAMQGQVAQYLQDMVEADVWTNSEKAVNQTNPYILALYCKLLVYFHAIFKFGRVDRGSGRKNHHLANSIWHHP